jgi:hypothetical protein
VYTSHFCDASGEHLTFLYGKYLTSSTEALEAAFLPLAPLAGARIAGWRRLAGRIVDHGEVSGLAARVDLELQRLLCLFTFPENDGEWESAVNRCTSTRQ